MNKKQKTINYTATIIKDVCWMILQDEYNMYPIYDYSENCLFCNCRKQLKNIMKIYKLSLEDIKNIRSIYHNKITYKICKEISKKTYIKNQKSKKIIILRRCKNGTYIFRY